MVIDMRERFEYEGISTGEYRGGFYVTYSGREYSAVYLGLGRFVVYSDTADENFTFPVDDGRYLMQTDIRDELLTRACEIRIIGVVRECYENVMIHDITENGVIVSTFNAHLGLELGLKPVEEFGFAGLIDKALLIGMYEERDYLWNPELGIYSTLCGAIGSDCKNAWLMDKDRITQLCVMEPAK